MLLLLIIKGAVLSQLWIWFIIPIGFLLQPPVIISSISFAISIGLIAIGALVNHLPTWHFKDYKEEYKYNIAGGLKPFILLLFGWIIHLFM